MERADLDHFARLVSAEQQMTHARTVRVAIGDDPAAVRRERRVPVAEPVERTGA
jgi:hypothetical protein